MKDFNDFLNEDELTADQKSFLKINCVSWQRDHEGFVSCFAITCSSYISGTGKLPVKFKKAGAFILASSNLTTLEGSPDTVDKDFACNWNNFLIDLKGAPKIVGQNFRLLGCSDLESLEGCPRRIGADFIIKDNKKLKSLLGGPTHFKGELHIVNCPSLNKEEAELDHELIKLWWKSKLSLKEFKKKYYGAIKMNKYDL